jgi:penicillin-binding protein 1A
MAQRLGVSRKMCDHCPSIVLGTGEVTPLEMATVYATLAADGMRSAPVLVSKVEDATGKTLLQNRPDPERVLDPQVARSVTDVLQGVVQRGTGRRADIGRPVAGKTGTAQEWRDAWFAGYTPQLATAVWMGHPAGQESMKGVAGVNVTGGSFPAQIWSAFMREAVAPLPADGFAPPDVLAWPMSTWVGPPPANLPPNILALLPPHLLPPPPAPLAPVVTEPPASSLPNPLPSAQPPSKQEPQTQSTSATTTTTAPARPAKKK